MDLGLAGKAALVTASSQGIGKACALALARAGADVVICARGLEKLEVTRDEITGETGRKVVAVRADLNSKDDIATLIAAARELGKIEVLVPTGFTAKRRPPAEG